MDTPRYDRALLVGSGISAGLVRLMLVETCDLIRSTPTYDSQSLNSGFREIAARNAAPVEKLFRSLSVALCGRLTAPGLFEALEMLGREESLGRIARAVLELGDMAAG